MKPEIFLISFLIVALVITFAFAGWFLYMMFWGERKHAEKMLYEWKYGKRCRGRKQQWTGYK